MDASYQQPAGILGAGLYVVWAVHRHCSCCRGYGHICTRTAEVIVMPGSIAATTSVPERQLTCCAGGSTDEPFKKMDVLTLGAQCAKSLKSGQWHAPWATTLIEHVGGSIPMTSAFFAITPRVRLVHNTLENTCVSFCNGFQVAKSRRDEFVSKKLADPSDLTTLQSAVIPEPSPQCSGYAYCSCHCSKARLVFVIPA